MKRLTSTGAGGVVVAGLLLALLAGLTAPALLAQDEPTVEEDPAVEPASADDSEPTEEELAAAEAAAERKLRMALVDAVDAWQAPSQALAAWLEERGRFMEASGLRRRLRNDDPSAANCMAEARAVLGFAELVLASGGGGGGIRAAYEDAKIAFQRARESGADDVETALGLARCAAAQGDAELEIAELAAAAKRWPDDGRAHRALGFAYQNAGRFDEAVPILKSLSDATPDELVLARALAYSARMAGDEVTAVAAAERAVGIAPDAPAAWHSLWSIYAPANRYGELSDAILRLVERYPDTASGAHYAGFALSSARRPDEALAWLQRAWERNEKNLEARLQAGRVLITDKSDDAAAAALFLTVLELSPGHDGALRQMAFLAVKLGNEQKHEQAVPYFRAVAEGYATNGQSWADLGLALRWSGRYEEAVTAYERAVQESPGDAQLRNDFGLLLLVMKRDDDAARVFEAAHEADPLANDCLENLGFMARERGDLHAAYGWFERAWDAAIRRGELDLIQRHRRNLDDVRFPLPPLR